MPDVFPDGEGFFETIKTIEGEPKFLSEHLNRAESTARELGIAIPLRDELAAKASRAVVEEPLSTPTGRLRIVFSKQGDVTFSHTSFDNWKTPARLMISSWEVDQASRHVSLKTLPYRENLEALELARTRGCDEIVRFNREKALCEGATSNILVKIDNEWCTPDLRSGCLPGIIRQFFIEHFSVKEYWITEADFRRAESIFLLSSLREIQPVSHIDGDALHIDEGFLRKAQQELAQFR